MAEVRDRIKNISDRLKISSKEELDLYLVASNRKPAAILQFSLRNGADSEDVAELGQFVSAVPLKSAGPIDMQLASNIIALIIGMDLQACIRVREAAFEHDKGISLGYPYKETVAFGTQNDLDIVYELQLAKAIREGVPVPIYMAYLSYVPVCFTHSTGNIEETVTLGMAYMEFTWGTNPDLSRRLEYEFENMLRDIRRGKRIRILERAANTEIRQVHTEVMEQNRLDTLAGVMPELKVDYGIEVVLH